MRNSLGDKFGSATERPGWLVVAAWSAVLTGLARLAYRPDSGRM